MNLFTDGNKPKETRQFKVAVALIAFAFVIFMLFVILAISAMITSTFFGLAGHGFEIPNTFFGGVSYTTAVYVVAVALRGVLDKANEIL